MRPGFLVAVVAAVSAILASASCRDPTEITLEITTDLPCSAVLANGGVAIRVGSPANVEGELAQQIEARTCVKGRIGSLVVVPSDAIDDQVAIFVAAGATSPTAACTRQSPKGCVLARRVLHYIPHTPLKLPIELSASCVDKACAPNETCHKGQCRSDTVPCGAGGVCEVPPEDAGVVDAAIDAPCTTCGGVCVDLTTSALHCGACNLACKGECRGGICRLLTANAMPDELTTKGCLAIAGTPPEVFWTMQRTPSGTSALYAADRSGDTLAALEGQIADLGGVSAGNNHVVYGVTTAGTAILRSTQTGSHTPELALASIPSAGHVAAVGRSTQLDRACWTTVGDALLRCTGWNGQVPAPGGGEFVALGPSVVGVGGCVGGIVLADVATGLTSVLAVAGAGIRGLAARRDADVFYATQGPALKLVTVKPSVQVAVTALDTLARPGLGIAYDAAGDAIYWVEDEGGGLTSIHGRPVLAGGTARTIAANQKGAYCVAVDDQAVYWLSAGVPHKAPK